MDFKKLKRKDTKRFIKVGDTVIGDGLTIIAGPCAVESEEQIYFSAKRLKELGINIIRGGIFKPRTSPHSFQGLGLDGLKYLDTVKKELGVYIVSEVMDPRDIDSMFPFVDIFQIGSRNMQNFSLLKEVGRAKKPVLLKRGMASTIREWLLAAEYIAEEGNLDIILCERGIRTFENYTRNTLDLSSVPIVKELTFLPIIVDPSHGTGLKSLILPMSKASIACGSDGLMIEVHPDPKRALSDGRQSLNFEEFEKVLVEIKDFYKSLEEFKNHSLL